MITIRNLHKNFGKNQVLRGLDLDVPEGEITAILGPNASGKTTLIKSILGLAIPSQGDIHWNGENIRNQYAYRKDIGYLSQIARFPGNLKVRELIEMLNDIRGGDVRSDNLIDHFNLNPAMNQKLSQLSGGTRQKVNIVSSLMFDTPLEIMDEPTVGLDPVALIKLKDFILKEKERQKTILLTTHIMNVVEEMADSIILLLEGKIYFQGTLEEMKAGYNEPNLERVMAKILQEQGGEELVDQMKSVV